MKKVIAISTIMLAFCAGSQNASAQASTMQNNTQVAPAQMKNSVRPMRSDFDLKNLGDCNVSASFSSNDFNWMGGNLKMTIYDEDIYDAVEVTQLKPGSTIIYQGRMIVVKTIKDNNGQIDINGGYDKNGASLAPDEGGTYKAVISDDHSVYSKIGKVEVPLSENFTIVDCQDDPHAPSVTIKKNQKQYIENLEKSCRDNFDYLNTTVEIQNGVITKITRTWMP